MKRPSIIGDKNPNWRGGKMVPCPICTKEIWKKPYQISKGRLYCSRKCGYVAKRDLDYSYCTGKNSSSWKGGASFVGKKLYKQLRKIKRYTEWRRNVYLRDDFTCINCGIRGGRLNADHFPIPFAIIIQQDNIRTVEEAMQSMKLWNINNGRTLCEACHKRIGWKGSHVIVSQNVG